jgi:hypothetical protein
MYLQKLNTKEVAVSKLCCPACWENFNILSEKHSLRGEAEMYKIRGRHSTVFPVQLPIWSPPDVVQELIKRFGRYLRTELDTMWNNHLQIQKQVPSIKVRKYLANQKYHVAVKNVIGKTP